MPEGPLGVRRPAVDADIVLLATVDSVEAAPIKVESVLSGMAGEEVEGINLDTSVLTYGFSIKLDTIAWDDLDRIKGEVGEALDALGMKVKGYSVTAR